MSDSKITKVWAREVLDSRGNPTVEAEVSTSTVNVTAIAPSGASTGSHEAMELRDGGARYGGKGVLKAVDTVRMTIAPVIIGMDVTDLRAVDMAMIILDGTENKSRLGGNATTAVSYACAKAGAIVKGVPLHEHLGKGSHMLPVPSMNVINGGKHAGGNLRPQEFMISPIGAKTFADSLRYGTEVYQILKTVLKDAIAAGDRIYAVIRGIAKNNDGANKVSFLAPSVDGQAKVIALAQAQRDGALIQYEKAIQTAFTDVSNALIAHQRVRESRI